MTCQCGHDRGAHRHYRPGSDCALCDCPRFRARLQRRTPIRQVSRKRAAQNRQRRAMARKLYPDRPPCAVPWCPRWADDLHEPLTRARGGSITDENNQVPTCRQHNDELTLEPAWGYELGLLKHSWTATP